MLHRLSCDALAGSRHPRRAWLLSRALALGLFLATPLVGCGDDDNGPGDVQPALTVQITAPASDATLFPNQAIVFDAAAAFDDDLEATVRYTWRFGEGTSVTADTSTATHAYRADGAFVVTVVAELVEGDAVLATATDSRSITVLRAPDLLVTAPILTLTSTTLTSADTLRVTFDLFNNGGDAPVAFDVGSYVVRDSVAATVPTTEELAMWIGDGNAIQLFRESFLRLDGNGASANVDRSNIALPSTLQSGTWHVLTFADPDGTIGETDRTNNAAYSTRTFDFVNTSGDGPDLLPSDVVVRPTRVNRLNSLTFSGRIANVGNQPAFESAYAIYLSYGDRTLSDDDVLIDSGDAGAIFPGAPFVLENQIYQLAAPATALGEYYVLFIADTDEAVAETDETNNVGISQRIVVTDEAVPGIDIVVDAFDVLPRLTYLGGSVEVTATIRNNGVEPLLSQFFCRIYLSNDQTLDEGLGGDRPLDTVQVPTLAAGETVAVSRISRIQSFFEPGDWYPFIHCDPSQAIAESDEENNIASTDGPITIAAEANIDLEIRAFSIAPSPVVNEGTVDVQIEVCNAGASGSTPTVVRVRLSADPILDNSDTRLLESRVPPLDPEQCVTVRADVSAVCDTFVSQYTAFAQVDGVASETNQENNVAQLPDPFVIQGLICDCLPDVYEPNDALARAAFLNPNVRLYEGLTMCTSNIDWYRVPLLRGETIRVATRFENRRGNLDLTLFAPDRSTELSGSRTNGDREEVSYFIVPQSGDYYIRVQGRTPSDRNVYQLELDVSARLSGTDLIVLNPRISPAAPVLGATVNVTFDLVNLGDTAAGPSIVRFYLSDDTDISPLTDPRLGELEVATVTDRTVLTVALPLPDRDVGGTSYIGIVADARDQVDELNEDNNTGVTPAFVIDDQCWDPLEPNNTLDEARLLERFAEPPLGFSDLRVCSNNRDVYEFCIDDGDYLRWSVSFNAADGDVDLRLYDETGTEVTRSEGIGNTETVQVDFANGDRCYRLEVYAVGLNREVPYSMTIDTGPAPVELQCSRIEEPNNAFAAATQLRDFLDADLSVCPVNDDDYFRIQLTAGTNVTFRLAPATGEAFIPNQLRLTLYNPSRAFITNTVTAEEAIQYRVAVSGNHFLRVRSNGAGPRSQNYRVVVEGVDGIDLVPSDLVVEPGAVAPGEAVRFSFTLSNARNQTAPASTYAVWLSRDTILRKTGPDADLLVREVAVDPVPGLTDRLEGRRFDVPGTIVDGGEYFVIVEVDSRAQIAEFVESNNLALASLFIAPRCSADLAEPNNFAFEPFDAVDAVGEPLSICTGDVDWFSWTAPTTRTTTVQISFSHAAGDLDLAVFADAASPPIAISDSITDNESVSFPAVAGTTYLFRVDSFYNETNSYTLTITP